MHRSILTLAIFFLALPAVPARADVVELVNGGLFEGAVTREAGFVRVRTTAGSALDFEEAQVREVRRGGWRDEYLRRLEASKAGSADERYRLALWCGSKGLAGEQEAELQAALAIDPAHRASRERLEALDAARRSAAAPGLGPAARPDPGALARHETGHVRAEADGSEDLARKVAEIAEGTVSDFAELFELPVDSTALKAFRVGVRYYVRKKDYEGARRAAGASGGSGFFNPMTGECHVSCEKEDGSFTPATRQTIRHEVAHALAMRVLGITAHRTWLTETLATAMEGTDVDGLGGGMIWTRLSILAHGEAPAGFSIDGLPKMGSGGPMSLEDYSRAWSFAHFIFYGEDALKRAMLLAPRRQPDPETLAALGRTRKESFLAMLADIRADGHRADVEGLFQKHFPDQEALQAAWQEHVQALIRTKLQPAMGWRLVMQADRK